MNKDIFLRDLRRFLADLPDEEKEQALKYYEDYFEDAGPENEEQVIQELGLPIDVAKQIKTANQENIAYGQGNDFQKNRSYPNLYEHREQSQNKTQNSQNHSNNTYQTQNQYQNQYQKQKKSWTQEPAKIVLVIIAALFAIPVGIPLIATAFGLLIAAIAVIFSLFIALFALGGGLTIGGIGSIIGSFYAVGSPANMITMIGVGLILTCVGIFIFWFGIFFCSKLFPALFRAIKRLFKNKKEVS